MKNAPEATEEIDTVIWPKKRGRPAKNLSETVAPARKTRSALAENNI